MLSAVSSTFPFSAFNYVSPLQCTLGLSLLVVLSYLVPYWVDPHKMRAYPGPFLARYTTLWLTYHSIGGHRSEVIHEMHKKYGSMVRIAPNNLSIAEPDALQVIYAHGNGSLKSNFYDAFVSIRRGTFNTRDRTEHTRKRKIVAHIFSPKSVTEFEPSIREHVVMLVNQWDRLCEQGLKGMSGPEGQRGGWSGSGGRVWFDCLTWFNFLAFDIIGDLAFGAPFGMLEAGEDAALVPKGGKTECKDDLDVEYMPAVQIINDRGDFSMTLGTLPPWCRPFVRHLPWFNKGKKAVKQLAGIAIVAVNKRLKNPTDRLDLLSKLINGKDEQGLPMGREELTAEALTQLIAGSDTTSNTSCAVVYYLARNQHIQRKLQKELDEELGTEDEIASTLEQVKRLPYLDAVINESMRLHSTSALGLPRVIPEGGITVMGHYFPAGSVLGVPSYTIHRNEQVWGEDAEAFRPERWFERDQAEIQKTFNPFSFGPRACVGRNLAFLELQVIISSLLRRYDFVLEDPSAELDTREGFLRKPVECRVGMRRREV